MRTRTHDRAGSGDEHTPATPASHALPRRSTWLVVSNGVVIASGLVVVVAFWSRFGNDPSLVAPAVIDRSAPTMQLPLLDAEGAVSLADFRGDVVVVNFWASWCLACRAEHDDLLAAAAVYRQSGVHFVGISFEDRPSDARAMLDELGWGPGYHYVTDPDYQAAFNFGIRGVPETFFIDRRGVIVDHIFGESTFAMLSGRLDRVISGSLDERDGSVGDS